MNDTTSTGATASGSLGSGARFPQSVLNAGFIFALVLAFLCLASSWWYLFTFLRSNQESIQSLLRQGQGGAIDARNLELAMNAAMVTGRLALLSCGMLIGLCFAFLGFALFLLGIQGEVDLEAARGTEWSLKLVRLSPGLFVIVCATVLVATSLMRRTPFEFRETSGTGPGPAVGSSGTAGRLNDLSGLAGNVEPPGGGR